MILLKLYLTFFKIGLFTIGGGLASLPLLKESVVDSGLISQTEFIDMIAISQSTPGPIGINMATFAGFKIASVAGGISATMGIVSPSLIIIILIAAFMKAYASNPYVQKIMHGIRPAAIGLIASAVCFIILKAVFADFDESLSGVYTHLQIFKTYIAHINFRAVFLFAFLSVFYKIKPTAPVLYIIAGAFLGIIIF